MTLLLLERDTWYAYQEVKDRLRAGQDLAVDLEWSGPLVPPNPSKPKEVFPCRYRSRLVGFSFGFASVGWYAPLRHASIDHVQTDAMWDLLRKLLALGTTRWWHNLKGDLQALRNDKLKPTGGKDMCSLLLAWMLNVDAPGKQRRRTRALKLLAQHLGLADAGDVTLYTDITNGRSAYDVSPEDMEPYAVQDAMLTARLVGFLRARASELAYDPFPRLEAVEAPFAKVLRYMEAAGVSLDKGLLQQYSVQCRQKVADAANSFEQLSRTEVMMPAKDKVAVGRYKNGNTKYKTQTVLRPTVAGAQVGSDVQVGRWLWDELKVMPTKGVDRTKEGRWPTDKNTLSVLLPRIKSDLGKRLVTLRLEHSVYSKLATTYTSTLVAMADNAPDGKLHGSMLQQGTVTGRLSMSNPNLQNQPRPRKDMPVIRKAFIPQPGWEMGVADYSQLELRIIASISGDRTMQAVFADNGDIHELTRQALGIATRPPAKTTNFSVIYGISPPSLARRIAVETGEAVSDKEAAGFIRKFLDTYVGIAAYHRKAIRFVETHGYARTLCDHRRYLDDGTRHRGSLRNTAINHPVQGTAAEIVKRAMLDLYRLWLRKRWLGRKANMLLQVHDELVCEWVPEIRDEAMNDLKTVMEAAGPAVGLRVPLLVEPNYGLNWAEAK